MLTNKFIDKFHEAMGFERTIEARNRNLQIGMLQAESV
jgi:hypothetical protein